MSNQLKKHYDTKFAENLKMLLNQKKKGGTYLYTVADELNITKPTLTGYRDGSHLPDIITFERIAKYFNVSADFLLGIENNGAYGNADIKTDA